MLRAGLRRVQLEDLTLDGRAQGAPLSRAWLALGGGAVRALARASPPRAALGASRRYCALS